MSDLLSKIDELQCANDELTSTAKQTQFQVESLQAACKKLTADRDEYRQEAKSASQRLSELADELDAAQRKAEKMEQDGGASDSKICTLTKRVEELRSALTEKSVDLKATSEALERQRRLADEVSSDLKKTRSEAQTLKQQSKATEQELCAELDSLRAKVKKLQSEGESQQVNLLTNADELRIAAETRASDMEKKLAEQTEALERAQLLASARQAKLRDADQKYRDLEAQMLNSTAGAAGGNAELSELSAMRQKVTLLETQLLDSQNAQQSAIAASDDIKAQLNDTSARLESAIEEIKVLQCNSSPASAEVEASLRCELECSQTELSKLNLQISALHSENQSLANQHQQHVADTTAEFKQFQEEINSKDAEFHKLVAELQQIRSDFQEQSQQLQTRSQELNAVKSSLDLQAELINELKAQCQLYQNQLTIAQTEISTLTPTFEAEITELKSRLEANSSELQAELDRTKLENGVLQDQISALHAQTKLQSTAIEELETAKAASCAKIDELLQKNANSHDVVESLNSQLSVAQCSIAVLKLEMEQRKSAEATSTAELAQVSEQLQVTQHEHSTIQETCHQQSALLESLQRTHQHEIETLQLQLQQSESILQSSLTDSSAQIAASNSALLAEQSKLNQTILELQASLEASSQQLETSAEEHQHEIESLFAKLSESNAEIESLTCKHQAELSSSHERCDTVERELLQLQDSSSKQIENLESVITDLNSQVSDISAQLEATNNETRESELKFRVKSGEFEAQLSELSQQLSAVNSNFAQLEESNSIHLVQESQLMPQLCDLKSQHDDEISSIKLQHASEIESIQNSTTLQVAAMTDRIDSAEAALKESQSSFSLQNEELIAQLSGQYQAQITSLQSEISVLQSKTDEFERQTQDLQDALLLEKANFQAAQQSDAQEIANLQLMFSESSGKLAIAQAESLTRIEELQQLLQQQTINENAMLDAMRNEHMETSCKLNESLKSAIDSVSEMQSKLALAQREVAANQECVSDLSAKLHAASASLELSQTENSNLKLELQQLQLLVDESSTELCNQKADASVQIAEFSSRLSTVQAQFDQTLRDHIQLKSALEIQESEHAKSISDLHLQSKQLELQIQQLHEQLTTSQSQLHEAEALHVNQMDQVKREHEHVLIGLREQIAQAAAAPPVDDNTRVELELVRSRLSEKTSQYHALQKKTTVLETKARVYQQKLEKLQAQSAPKNSDDAENDCAVMNQ